MKLKTSSRKNSAAIRKREAPRLIFADKEDDGSGGSIEVDLAGEKMKAVKRQLSVGLLLAKRSAFLSRQEEEQDAASPKKTCLSLRVVVEDDDTTQPPSLEEDDGCVFPTATAAAAAPQENCSEEEEKDVGPWSRVPLEIMVMIAGYLNHPGKAHPLSLVCHRWNSACQVAFPMHKSPRFILYAMYENQAFLAKVESIADNETALLALCATVRDATQLERLARPSDPGLYMKCFKAAVQNQNAHAMSALLKYGLGIDKRDPSLNGGGGADIGWTLPALLDVMIVFTASNDESAPLYYYRAVENAGKGIAAEIVRATCFRRYAIGIKTILKLSKYAVIVAGQGSCAVDKEGVYGTDENVRQLLTAASTMNEELLLSVLSTFPEQTGRLLSLPFPGGGADHLIQSIIRTGWIKAADAIIEIVDDYGQDPRVLLRYSVITGKTWLVRDILFPPRRSSRSKTRDVSKAGGGSGIVKRKRSLSQSPGPLGAGPVTLTNDSLLRESILLGHEDIAMLLCLSGPQFVTGPLVVQAVRAGHRAEFIKHMYEYLSAEDQQMFSNPCIRTAIASKNYEVIAMLISDFENLLFDNEVLLSILALLGPFKVYAPIVSILLHSPRFRDLF